MEEAVSVVVLMHRDLAAVTADVAEEQALNAIEVVTQFVAAASPQAIGPRPADFALFGQREEVLFGFERGAPGINVGHHPIILARVVHQLLVHMLQFVERDHAAVAVQVDEDFLHQIRPPQRKIAGDVLQRELVKLLRFVVHRLLLSCEKVKFQVFLRSRALISSGNIIDCILFGKGVNQIIKSL